MDSSRLTDLPYGLDGKVYRSPLPHSPLFDPEGTLLDTFVQAGVAVVVMLTPEKEVREVTGRDLKRLYEKTGFDVIHVPIEDFSVPERGAFQQPIRQVVQSAQSGQTVVIHCHAGLGRTGMFAACLAKAIMDLGGDEAVRWVRHYVPDAVQTAQQYRYVENFSYQPEES